MRRKLLIFLLVFQIILVGRVFSAQDSPQQITRTDSIYFIMTDRFADGDPNNNDGDPNHSEHGEYVPDDLHKYNGGDFEGIIKNMDYIKSMGFTAIWITPVVYNFQGLYDRYAAYHGYWAEDFSRTDPHLGSLEKLKELVNIAHVNDIDVIIDVVFNHMSPRDVNPGYQYKYFNWNDFHHNGTISQWAYDHEYMNNGARWQLENYDLAGLADLNTAGNFVRDTLTSQHTAYYNYINADGMRWDAIKHVSKTDWVRIRNMMKTKISKSKKTFTIGEAFQTGGSQSDIAGFIGWYTIEDAQSGGKALDSVFNFGLYTAINYMFDEGARILAEARANQFDAGKYGDPYVLGNFVDNHDLVRFLGRHNNNWDRLKEALTLIFTWPGIPVVYYGTEQAMTDYGGGDPANRYPLWKVGYNKDHPLYQHIRKLNRLRNGMNKTGRALRYGSIRERWSNENLYAFERINEANKALVIVNTSGNSQRIYNLTTEIGPGWHTEKVNGNKKIEVQQDGRINESWLAPYEILVYSNEPEASS